MLIRLAALTLLIACPGRAEAPRVVADILPVHSLVAQVMEGVGAPDLMLGPGASPHSYSMRPSEAAMLEQAEVVFWIGPALTPWLQDPIANLAGDAVSVSLLDLEGTLRLGSDDHDHDHNHDEPQLRGEIDPHAWLDPENARHWLFEISAVLSTVDPANAETYSANAQMAADTIKTLQSDMARELSALIGKPYAVNHDAYRYLENRFGLSHRLAITSSHAVAPSPSRIAALRATAQANEVDCVLIADNERSGLLETVFQGLQVNVRRIDPIGANSAPGPLLYMDLMHRLARDLGTC